MKSIEKVLIEKMKNGDVSSFETIFRSNYDELYQYALGLIGDQHEAEDFIQDLFIWLWENKIHIRLDMSLKSYLLKILHNRAINQIKHKKVRNKFNDEEIKLLKEEERLQEDYYEYFKEKSSFENLEEKITKAIDQLPEQCRKIFRMNRLEGLKYREISDRLNLSLSTIKNQMSIALRKIKENL